MAFLFLSRIMGSIPVLVVVSAFSSAEYYTDYNSADFTVSRTPKLPFEHYFLSQSTNKSLPREGERREGEETVDILEEAEKKFEQGEKINAQDINLTYVY